MAKAHTNGLHPTAAKKWRQAREEGFLITLPSGNVARLRPVALDVLIMSGKLPDLLTPIAARTLWMEQDPASIGNTAELAKGYAELVNLVIPAAFMEPRIVENPTADDEIGLDDLDFTDKVAVFNLCTASAEVLRNFRYKQAGDVAVVSDGENNGIPAV